MKQQFRKILSLTTAAALTLGMVVTVHAADSGMTRGEMAKLLVEGAGLSGQAAEYAAKTSAFRDVAEGSAYEGYINLAYAKGLMSGTAPRTFAPDAQTTRAMMWTLLARLDGQDVSGASPWYDKAMTWATQSGVSDGTMPEVNITREQLATMLYSYAKLKGLDTTQGGMAVREFNDYDSISSWAGQSMTWAVNAGILSGRGNNTLAPTAGATRAEMAVMLQQFVGLMEK